jgi:hypothetical protein
MTMADYANREVGWLVTKQYSVENTTTRVGWGQLRIHATETDASYDRELARTVFMDKSLTEHMIPDRAHVRWIAFDADGNRMFDGIVSVSWLMNNGDELAFNIDRFCEADVGATKVVYSLDDILIASHEYGRRDWSQFVFNYKNKEAVRGEPGRWAAFFC